MDKQKQGIYYHGHDAERVYESYKAAHLNPGSLKHGAVLCTTKRIHHGFEIKVKLFFRAHWDWKPRVYWRYGTRYFHWLFFMIWLDKCFITRMDKVVKDHLNEAPKV